MIYSVHFVQSAQYKYSTFNICPAIRELREYVNISISPYVRTQCVALYIVMGLQLIRLPPWIKFTTEHHTVLY